MLEEKSEINLFAADNSLHTRQPFEPLSYWELVKSPNCTQAIHKLAKDVKSNRRSNKITRKMYSDKKADSLHRTYGQQTAETIDKSLASKIKPGLRPNLTADANGVRTTIVVPITTRAMGFGTLLIHRIISSLNSPPPSCTVCKLYRIALALFEARLEVVQREATGEPPFMKSQKPG